jgi:hypothetical protein
MLHAPSTISGQPRTEQPLAETLAAMAYDFHAEWQRRFGRPGTRPCAGLQGDTLTLRMEEAFTPTERALSRHAGGPATVRKQLETLLDDLYPWMAEQVESRLGCRVAESRVLMNFADESISYAVTLRDMPRFLMLQPAVQSCEE